MSKAQDVVDALELVESIETMIDEEMPEYALAKGQEFFDSVLEKAKAIGATIEKTQRVSDKQMAALERMVEGVRAWLHED